jgi:ADP-ribose pyrophosphatase YjhB (NUDIX family)
MSKKIKYTACTNCGKKNHKYSECDKPVTSWGIILVNLNGFERPIHKKTTDITDEHSYCQIETTEDRIIVAECFTNIQFLMVSRKNSLGYIEFIRGRYKPHKIDKTIHLFKQMKSSEIEKIKNSTSMDEGFEYLWKDLWGNKCDKKYLSEEKNISKQRYDVLRFPGVNSPDIDLDFIIKNVRSEYNVDEWGFPKGRKNKTESDFECAIREFEEETGYAKGDYQVIEEIKPIQEDFIGTNGIKYKHIYYIAELLSFKLPKNDITESQKNEIGNIGFFNFHTGIEFIRNYHIERKCIFKQLFVYYMKKIIEHHKLNDHLILNMQNNLNYQFSDKITLKSPNKTEMYLYQKNNEKNYNILSTCENKQS